MITGELYHPVLGSSRSGQPGASASHAPLSEHAVKRIAEAVRADRVRTRLGAGAARVGRANPLGLGGWKRAALAILLLAASLASLLFVLS